MPERMDKVELQSKVLDFINRKGPILPIELGKELEMDTFFVGAILSELVDSGKIKISKAKIGGSPVYYLPSQGDKLSRLKKSLKDPEKKAYDLLQAKRILRDKELDSLMRVAMREIKDFAYMLQVKVGDGREIFWKWHLIPDSEAEQNILTMIKPKEEPIEVKEPEVKEEVEESKIEEEPIEIVEEKPKKKRKPRVRKDPEEIKNQINEWFNSKEIDVVKVVDEKELEYIVEVPSKVGKVRFFVKYKDKKKVNDTDLGLVRSDLPVLFLGKGELTKKGLEFSEKHNISFEKL